MSTRNRVNVKAVLIILGTCAGLGIGVHFLHGFQVKRNARAVFELQLEEGAKKGANSTQIMQYLERYRTLRPDDTEGLAEYALLNEKRAKNPRERLNAYLLLEDVVRRDGRRDDIRRLAAKLGTSLGRFDTAKEDLQRLLKDHPADVELMHYLARCEAGLRNENAALDWYTKASKGSKDTKLWLEFAFYLRDRWEQNERADEVIEDMVVNDPRTAATRLEAARYFYRFARYDPANKHLGVAIKDLGSQDADLLLLAAHVSEAKADLAEARRHLERGLKLYAKDTRFSRELAGLDLRQGQREQALANLQPSLKDLPTEPDQLWNLGYLLIETGDFDRVGEVLRRLEQLRCTTQKEFLRAHLLMRRGTLGEARTILEKARSEKLDSTELEKHINLLLAQCHDRLLNPDQAQEAYRRVLAIDSKFQIARSGLARSLVAAGKPAKAADEYRKIHEPTAEVRAEFAHLLWRSNLSLPPSERNWDEMENLLSRLSDTKELSQKEQRKLGIPVLRAEMLLARDREPEARALLEAEVRSDARQVGAWLALTRLAARGDNLQGALQVLDEAERQSGKWVELYVARVDYLSRLGKADDKKALAGIEGDLEQFPEADQDRLLSALADAFLSIDDRAAAHRLCKRLAERQPRNLSVRMILFDEAFTAGKIADMERLAREIKDLEGGSGPVSLVAEASLRIDAGRGGDKKALVEARSLLAKAANLRPSWGHVAVLEARTYDMEGNKEKATERYQAALDRGENRLAVIRRLVQLFFAQGRYADAHAYLSKLPEPVLTGAGLERLAVQATLLNPQRGEDPAANRQKALQMARKAAQGSKEYGDHLWLGQVALLAGEKPEAEKGFRQALTLNDRRPEAWVSLILVVASTDPKAAATELARAEQKLDADKAPLALAPCYEALGKQDQAEALYRKALARNERDPKALQQTADFYFRYSHFAKAEPYLRRLLEPQTKAPETITRWARRGLALRLAMQGPQRQFQEALALAEEGLKKGAASEDKLTKTLVLATRTAHRRDAIRDLEGLTGQRLAPQFQLILLSLYEDEGNWSKARSLLVSMLAEHERNPALLVRYVSGLLRQGDAEEAQRWVDKLVEIAPKSPETLEWRVRTLKARNRLDEAVALVNDYAKQAGVRLDLAAMLLEWMGRPKEAEALYRRLARESNEPIATLVLAEHLARQSRTGEALDLCEQAWKTCPPETVARVSLKVVQLGKGNDEQNGRVEAWLADAMAKYPKETSLLVVLAEQHNHRRRYDEAMALYRQILRQDQGNIVALNNLGYLLALKESKYEEALGLVNTAIDLVGAAPPLLHTRAVIYLRNRQADLAQRDLKVALGQKRVPLYYFHLAQAEEMAQNRAAAVAAFRQATSQGLQAGEVHPLERPAFERMLSEHE